MIAPLASSPATMPPITVARFTTAFPDGPALGVTEHTGGCPVAFSLLIQRRRVGDKDGPAFIPSTFKPEPDSPAAQE